MNIFKRKISAAEESLATLQADFDSLNEKYAQLEADFKRMSAEALTYKEDSIVASAQIEELETELEEKVEEFETQLEEKTEEIVEIVAEQIDADVLASMKAVEILASCGAEPVELVEADDDSEDVSNTIKNFKKLSGKERTAFYQKHSAEIKKALKNQKF
jgi:chromosome segregation ATPase